MDTIAGWISATRDILVILNMLGTIAVLLVAYWAYQTFLPRRELVVELDKRDEKRDAQFATVNDAVHEIDQRLARGETRFREIEVTLGTLPTASQISELQVSIERLSGGVAVVAERIDGMIERVKGVERQVHLVDSYVRNNEIRRGPAE